MNTDEVKIIILPGWDGSRETWKDFIEKAEKKYAVECIDLPCFGDEPCPSEVWGVAEYANFIKSKISSRQRDTNQVAEKSKIILLGHSFGGQVASYLTAINPDIVASLILVAPAVFRPKNYGRRILFGSLAKIGKILGSSLLKNIFYKAIDARDYANTYGTKRDIFKKVIREDISQIVSKINIPTLILWGDNDTYTPVNQAKKLRAIIPNSELIIFKDAKHGLHIQKPIELLEQIDSFIQRH